MPRRFSPEEEARRLHVMRKMAAAGKYQADAAKALGLSVAMICRTAKEHGIVFQHKPNVAAQKRHAIVRNGYELGLPLQAIASTAGITPGAVSVIASRLQLTRKTKYRDRAADRRGFSVPENMALKYRGLRYLGLSTREAGIELGLLRRDE